VDYEVLPNSPDCSGTGRSGDADEERVDEYKVPILAVEEVQVARWRWKVLENPLREGNGGLLRNDNKKKQFENPVNPFLTC